MSSIDFSCYTGSVKEGETTMDLGGLQNLTDEMGLELNYGKWEGFKNMEKNEALKMEDMAWTRGWG